jgi:hypothetical protein
MITHTPLSGSRAVITSLVMAAVLFVYASGPALSQPPAPAPGAIILTPRTDTVRARGADDTPGTTTRVLGLTMPEITTHTFSRGGVIEVPEGTRLTEVNLTVSASESRWIGQDLLLELYEGDRTRAMASNVKVVTIDGQKVARFVVPDCLDPIRITSERPLRVLGVIKKKGTTQEWTVQARPGRSHFISEQAGEHKGERLRIAIEEPIAPPIRSRETPAVSVSVKGQVTPADELTRLAVADVDIRVDRTEPSQRFTASVTVGESKHEFVVEAEDKLGRAATVIIPIASPGARKNRCVSN